MKIIKFVLSVFVLLSLSSCIVSFPDNRTNVAFAESSQSVSCKLNRLDTYLAPPLPDVANIELEGPEDMALLGALITHIGALRKDISMLKSNVCNNY